MANIDDAIKSMMGTGALPAMPNERNQRGMGTYYHTIPTVYGEKKTTNPEIPKVLNQIQSTPYLPAKDGVLEANGVKIWSYLNPTSQASPYDQTFRIDQQRHIENFMEFSRRANNLQSRSNRYFGLDIETLGDRESNLFMVSEISVAGHTMKDGEYRESKRMSFNRLVAPDPVVMRNGKRVHGNNEKELRKLIHNFRANPQNFSKLSPSLQRTLVDLVRYSSIAEEGMHGAAFGKNVIHSSYIDKILEGKTIQVSELLAHANQYSQHMLNGLGNLVTHGADPLQTIEEYNEFVSKHGKSFFVTMNGDKFDFPAMQQWGKNLNALNVVDPKYQLDYQKAEMAIARNPLTLHNMYGRVKDLPYEEGSMTLNEHRRTLGMATDAAHAANFDSGMQGVGGVVARTWRTLDSMVRGSQIPDHKKMKKLIGVRSPYLKYDTNPLTMNDTLFATRAIQNYAGHALDHQAILNQDGTYSQYKPGFNTNVINAETSYKPIGFKQLDDPISGTSRLALELMDVNNKNLRSFVVREGNHAAYEIADFVQRYMEPQNRYSASLNKKIYNINLEDKARRRYEGLFDTNSSATRGFEAAKRMYGNASIYQQRLNGSWKNIYEEANAQTMEVARTIQEKLGRGLTPEELNEIRYTRVGRLLKQRMTHDEMIEQMNFKSDWDSVGKTFVKNEAEAEQFWKMAPRLVSELPLYQEALQSIEKNIEDPKLRDVAWAMFHQEVKETLGDHRTSRKPLPYEEAGFKYHDKLSNKSVTVSTATANEAINKISSIIYKDTKDLSEEEKNQLIRERYKTTLASLEDSGIINNANDLLEEHYRLNLSIPDSVRQLALDLMDQNHRIREEIQTTSLRQRTAVENVSSDVAAQMIKRTIKQAKGFQGYLINGGTMLRPDLFQGDMDKFFSALDRPHPLTGLQPNNRQAVEKIMSHYMNIDKNLHAHLGVNKAGTEAILTMFNKDNAHQVLRHLNSGATEAHAKSFEVRIPLVTRQGTISYGNNHMNAVTDVVYENGKFVQRSSVEKLASLLTDPAAMDEMGLYDYKKIKSDLRDGNFEEATNRSKRSIRTSLDELSGIKRDYNNSLRYEGNEADLSKQSRVYFDSAMIQDLYKKGKENGGLDDSDFANKDVIINSKNKVLHPNVGLSDLWANGKHKVRVNMADWAKENGLGDLFFSNVKGDVVIDGGASRIDARDLLPYGHLTNQGRDNSVQFQNTRKITDEIEDGLKHAGTYTNLDDMTVTKKKLAYDQRLNYKREVNIKAAYMSQSELNARIDALKATPEGEQLLRDEGILLENGEYSKARFPSVYEQQALLHEDLIDAFQMDDYKFNRGDSFDYHPSIYDKKTGEFINTELKPGDTIGWRTKDGMREPVRWEQKSIGNIVSSPSDPTVAIRFKEDAVKFHLDIEKLTPSGGNSGYSAEFFEALTGDATIGAIYNPDIGKHEDFGAVLRAQSNKVHAYVSAMSEADRTRAFEIINKARIGVKVEELEDSFRFLDTSRNYKKGINVKNFYRLFDKLNTEFSDRYGTISENLSHTIGKTEFPTTWGIQGLRASSVVNYATMVDDKKRAVLSYDLDENGEMTNVKYGSEVKGVKYGPRELGVLRRAGLTNVHDYVVGELKKSASETGRLNEALGMIHSIGGMAYGPEAMDPDAAAKTLRVGDFAPLPVEDSNKISLSHTVLDADYIQQKIGDSRGFWMELPKIHVDGQEHPLPIEVDGKPLEKIFIPNTQLEGKGNEVWKRDLQRQISGIYNKAAAASAATDPKEKYRVHGDLQNAVSDYTKFLVGDVTSSSEQVGNMLKVNMPYSSSGMAKVLPFNVASQLEGETTFISAHEARVLGVYDHIMSGKDFYAPDLRYPTFTDKAIQVVKLKIDPHAQAGYHNVSSMSAAFLGQDSDGDYNNLLAIHGEESQEEMAARYEQQMRERAARHEIAYNKATQASLYDAELGSDMKKDKDRTFTMDSLANENGIIEPTKINSTGEMLAKTGKELVGQASDVNYFMRQLAEQYAPNEEAKQAIYDFGEGLEQKLTISAKHFKDGNVEFETRAGASDFLNALRNGRFNEVAKIDETYFNNMFATDWNMNEALYHLQSIQMQMKDGMLKENSLRFGTSTGAKLGENGENLLEIADTIFGKNPNATTSNEHAKLIQELMQDAGMMEERMMPNPEEVRPVLDPLNPLESTPSKKRLGGDFKSMVADTFEDMTGGIFKQETYDKVRDTLRNTFDGPKGGRNKVIAAAGGLALAGLIGYNTLRNDPVMPYATPEQTQPASAPDYGQMPPQPALAPIESGGGGGAHISVSAKGKGHNASSFSGMVGEGMNRSNYSGGKINMSVNHTDNTAQLNRIWYRDKVDQYA